jgi:hypothetical protein
LTIAEAMLAHIAAGITVSIVALAFVVLYPPSI